MSKLGGDKGGGLCNVDHPSRLDYRDFKTARHDLYLMCIGERQSEYFLVEIMMQHTL